ncbi:PilZ domain-containing protein [Geobacter sp. FeAm09]|uniref:PilZ domain-containing protein n=1 Tax=Geobacter sp. FeAm09 TaxID=2597769 RepID=UPI00143D559C|nr:PilZ domain-containing protein [Geobacter sp. FeAm09]
MSTRRFTRVEISVLAEIEYDDRVIAGEIMEISLRGLFVKTGEKIPLGRQVYVKARYLRKEFQFPATVIYEQEQGVGLKIDEINLPSFFHLRELIASKIDDPDAVIQETFIMADIITG